MHPRPGDRRRSEVGRVVRLETRERGRWERDEEVRESDPDGPTDDVVGKRVQARRPRCRADHEADTGRDLVGF